MAVEISVEEATRRFSRPQRPAPRPPRPQEHKPQEEGLGLKAVLGRMAEIEGQLAALGEKLEDKPRPPVVAEVYYNSDGRVKSVRMGKFGATVSRDADGRMRKININEI